MNLKNPKELLGGIFQKLKSVPPESFKEPKQFSAEDLQMLKRIGIDTNSLRDALTFSTQINFERTNIYKEVDRAVLHWMVGSATELYADYATNFNTLQNASVWITSESHKYTNNLTTFLESIGIEEKIFDWAWTVAAYGDLFIGVEGVPGLGVVAIDDTKHPSNLSRVDYKGTLVGFYFTPHEAGSIGVPSTSSRLLAPWEWVHMRILGAKMKRPMYGDPTFSEYRTVHLMGPETKQVTSKYGSSLLINSLPIYKRLRLAEDSILLARLTRGILKYVYKIKVDGMNVEAASAIIDEYMTILKRARALNTDPNNPNYDSKSNPMACLRGNTKVRLYNGECITIVDLLNRYESGEVVKDLVWSINPDTLDLEADRIVSVQKTRLNAEMVRIHINSGSYVRYIDCTPDHKFMLKDGTYKEAQYLELDEALMSCTNDPDVSVSSVRLFVEREDVYDLTVEKNHNFSLGAGIIVHNSVEDLFIPVWGDVNDIQIEEIGGKTDIRWIVDVEELRNQLASALRCPLALLGGYVQEASGQLGSEAISQLDIRFARSARRLQRAIIEGVTRLCQIHLAYQNMDPDPRLFEVHMAETSTAEEKEISETLGKNVDVIGGFMNMLDDITEGTGKKFDKVEIADYFNRKILKLGDLDLKSFLVEDEEIEFTEDGSAGGDLTGVDKPPSTAPYVPPTDESDVPGEPGEEEMTIEEPLEKTKFKSKGGVLNERKRRKIAEQREQRDNRGKITRNLDYIAHLPLPDNTQVGGYKPGSVWEKNYKDVEITHEVIDEKAKEKEEAKKKAEADEISKGSKKSEGSKPGEEGKTSKDGKGSKKT